MKVHHTKYKPRYEAFILENLDCDYARENLNYSHHKPSKDEKIRYLAKRFKREKKSDIEQMGIRPALIDWLAGIALPIPVYNGDIIELAERLGSIDKNPSDKLIERVLENYFPFMANIILNMEGFTQCLND